MAELTERNAAAIEAIQGFLATDPASSEIVEATAAVNAETSPLSLTNLHWWERKIRAELRLAEHHRASSRWKLWAKTAPAASWLQLCSGDGYAREKAVRELSEGLPNSFSFMLFLRRLNDWVPQVRVAAREQLPLVAQRSDPVQVADALWCTFPHWSAWGRMTPVGREAILTLMSLERVAHRLKTQILSSPAGPAALVLSQAGRTSALDQWLVDFAQAAVQPSVRARAYQYLLEGRVCWVIGRKWVWTEVQWCKGRHEPVLEDRKLSETGAVMDLLRAAAVDRSPFVRRVAAEFLVQHRDSLGVAAHSLAERLSVDSSSYVALRGRFVLAKLVGEP